MVAPSSSMVALGIFSAITAVSAAAGAETFWSPPSSPLGSNSTYELSDGTQMPVVGFGVHQSRPGEETYLAVLWALQAGYRLVDSAAVYGNEEDCGRAIRDSGVPRGEIFVMTKLSGDDHGFEKTLLAFEESRKKLGLDYIDLYLVHSPYGGKLIETWDALLHLRDRGLLRSVGFSTFDTKHIEALERNQRPLPAVNQIEMHPLIYRERQSLMRWCRDKGVLIQAYGSILYGQTNRLQEEPLLTIAREVGRSAAQVLLRWGLQHRFQIIPKSVHQDRIKQNLNLFDFDLSQRHMSTLDAWEDKLGMYWNPLEAEVHIGDTHHRSPPSDDGAASSAAKGEAEL